MTYDFIIIGSGFGGSVSAMRLTEKGYSVLVLEKGKRYDDKDFAKTNWQFWKYLWLPALRGTDPAGRFLQHRDGAQWFTAARSDGEVAERSACGEMSLEPLRLQTTARPGLTRRRVAVLGGHLRSRCLLDTVASAMRQIRRGEAVLGHQGSDLADGLGAGSSLHLGNLPINGVFLGDQVLEGGHGRGGCLNRPHGSAPNP